MKFVTIILFLSTVVSFAKLPPSTWYFGRFAGIEFPTDNSMLPYALNDGMLDTKEGSAIATDECGNLLFYTDGIYVWNAEHEVVIDDLRGNFTSTTSVLVTEVPNNPQRYYIFTVDAQCGNDGLRLTTLDLSSGNIEVVEKNKVIIHSVAEKMEMILHENGLYFWLVVMRCDGALNAFLVDEDGIAERPIESDGGFEFASEFNAIGQMKANIEGNIFAASINALDRVMIYNFDRSSGRATIKNELIERDFRNAYGLEFSPNGRYLFVGTTLNEEFDIPSSLFQLDLNYQTDEQIFKNRHLLASSMTEQMAQLQLGPDNRIYAAIFDKPFLSVIDNPNENGSECDYKADLIDLSPFKSRLGLPHIPKKYFKSETQKKTISTCEYENVQLEPPYYDQAQYKWSGKAGDKDTRQIEIDNITQKDAGVYIVDVIHPCFEKRIEYTIVVRESPRFYIHGNTQICEGQSTKLWVERDDDNLYPIEWSTGDRGDTLTVSQPGYYTATTSKGLGLCSYTDSIEVVFKTADFDIAGNNTLCEDDFTELRILADPTLYDFEWNTGERTQSITVNTPGNYSVYISENGECLGRATITILQSNVEEPELNVSKNEKICSGSSINIEVTNYNEEFEYYWSDGYQGHNRELSTSGEFKIYAESIQGCVDSTTFSLEFLDEIEVEIYGKFVFCEGSQTSIRIDNINDDYKILWSNGNITPSIVVKEPGNYWVSVETEQGCIVRDTVNITMIPAVNLKPNYEGLVEICQNEPIEFELEEVQENVDYYWSDGTQEINRMLNKKGEYILYAENVACKDSVLIQLLVNPVPDVNITASKEALICGVDHIVLSVENPQNNVDYLWSTGETTTSITVYKPDIYTLYGTNQFGCTDSSKYEVVEDSADLNLSILGNTGLCEGETITLAANQDYASYEWTTGETTKSIEVNEPGIYGLLVVNELGCDAYEEIEVVEYSLDITLPDQILFEEICSGETSSQIIQIINTSENEIVLEALESNLNDVFSISGLPITIAPKTTENINFNYSPEYPINHSTTGKLIFEEPCYVEYEINLVGSAYNEIEISLSPINGSPGYNVCSQATISNVCGNEVILEKGVSVEFELEYPRNLFYLQEVSNPWTVQSYVPNIILNNDEKVDLKQSQLFEICGTLLLDKELKGNFRLISDSWLNYNIRTKVTPNFGEIDVDEVCVAENRVIALREIDFVSVNTKENNGNAELVIASSLTGDFEIDIYDYYGNNIYSDIKHIQNEKYSQTTFILDNEFNTGVYFVLVKSPQKVLETKFIITR